MTDKTLAPDTLGPTVCVGEILVEIVATTTGNGFLEAQPLTGPYPSGAPAIFIDQCGRMGGSAAMIGAVGNDDFGRVNLERLQRDNIDVSGIRIDPDFPTGSAFVRYRSDGSRDFVYNIATSAAARFGWTDQIESLIRRAGHLHIMGSALSMPSASEVIMKSVPEIQSRGGTLSLDPNLRKEITYDQATQAQFNALINLADLLLPSGEELALAAGVDNEAEAVSALFERGVREIVLKRGNQGASCFLPSGDRIDARAFAVEERDPTGAGDCFGGAYLTSRRLGLPVADSLQYGCAAGAHNVTTLGPMEGAATRAELDRFMACTPRQSS